MTAVGALSTLTRASSLAAQTTPQFGSPDYEAALKITDGIKGVFQSPALDAMSVAGDNVNHLLLIQLKNWLNSFQFAYKDAPEDLHTLSATYGAANVLTYGDAVWEKYKLGEKYKDHRSDNERTGYSQRLLAEPVWPRCPEGHHCQG